VHGIDAEADDLGVAPGELGLKLGQISQFGGADRGEVLRMGEEDAPGVAQPVVEADRSLRGFGLEIGRGVADAERHSTLHLLMVARYGVTERRARPRRKYPPAAGSNQRAAGVPDLKLARLSVVRRRELQIRKAQTWTG